MSASAARRRKQLAAKAAAAGADPITTKMNSLLANSELTEPLAYEALQLTQSQVRKAVIAGDYKKATETYGYDVLVILLTKQKASVASQLLTLLVQVLNETHTACNPTWITKIQHLASLNLAAIQSLEGSGNGSVSGSGNGNGNSVEYKRLMKLHAKFLKSALAWSTALGTIRFGCLEFHKLLADQLWELSIIISDDVDGDDADDDNNAMDESNDDNNEDYSTIGLQSDAVTHYSLAEDMTSILTKLKTLPGPTTDETTSNHTCPPNQRESLLTRSILLLLSIENIRDAIILLQSYLQEIETRDLESLKKSYMSKTDGKAPSHPIFLSMILEICRKNVKTGPLYNWAMKGFSAELSKMYKSDILKLYTNTIGNVYFHIQPPPSMMQTIENMMGMMGGAGGPGGAGGMGGMNPAMMQAMMSGMGGGM